MRTLASFSHTKCCFCRGSCDAEICTRQRVSATRNEGTRCGSCHAADLGLFRTESVKGYHSRHVSAMDTSSTSLDTTKTTSTKICITGTEKGTCYLLSKNCTLNISIWPLPDWLAPRQLRNAMAYTVTHKLNRRSSCN